MSIYQHGDRSGDRSGQAPKVYGDSWGSVRKYTPLSTLRLIELTNAALKEPAR